MNLKAVKSGFQSQRLRKTNLCFRKGIILKPNFQIGMSADYQFPDLEIGHFRVLISEQPNFAHVLDPKILKKKLVNFGSRPIYKGRDLIFL